MNRTITLPRSVVEQALSAIVELEYSNSTAVSDKMARGSKAALRAALEQPEVVTDHHQLEQSVEQEPIAWMFQHDETGRIQYVDSQQIEWGFEKGNPRWQKIAPVYTHPQNLNCKSNQARLATLWGYVKEQPQQEQEWKRRLGNLLAVIHGDGGHYIDAHGWDKAQADAEERVARVMTGLPQSASVVWPRNAGEVRAFLSGHVAAERYARDDHQPDDSDTYTLSAHDLLGAIDWWTDCAQSPRQPLTDLVKDAFFEGFTSVETYNDTRLNSVEEAWAEYKAAHGIGGEK
ncbi:MAG: hypothetical protein ACRCTG_16785 [Aestuariivirga sp.]